MSTIQGAFCSKCSGLPAWLETKVSKIQNVAESEAFAYDHHATFKDLLSASAQGCPLCGILCDMLNKNDFVRNLFATTHTDEPNRFLVTNASGAYQTPLFYETNLYEKNQTSEDEYHGELLPLELYVPSTATVSGTIASHARVAVNTFLQHCLKDCIETHGDDCRASSGDFLPTRLVDIEGGDDYPGPKLVLSASIDLDERRNLKYATLSHCWGPPWLSSHVKTKRYTNLESRLITMPLATLNETFRDAITVTRMLNLRYVWIDSLCIIQEDQADWETESLKMSEVYSNAFINIAAVSARNGDEGFLHPRATRGVELTGYRWESLKYDPRIRNISYTFPDEDILHAAHSAVWIRGQPTWGGPLLYRGWVLQETLLAPRTVTFDEDQAHFRCSRHQWDESLSKPFEITPWAGDNLKGTVSRLVLRGESELWHAGGTNIPRIMSVLQKMDVLASLRDETDRMYYAFSKTVRKWKHTQESQDMREVLQLWHEVVAKYSAMNLSYETDRLIALSGVSRFMASRIRTRFVAGIWQEDLPLGLCWACESGPASERQSGEGPTPNLPASRSSLEVARIPNIPSWSWACSPQTKCYLFNMNEPGFVFDARVRCLEVGGAVLGYDGYLKLAGKLMEDVSVKYGWCISKTGENFTCNVFWDDPYYEDDSPRFHCLLLGFKRAADFHGHAYDRGVWRGPSQSGGAWARGHSLGQTDRPGSVRKVEDKLDGGIALLLQSTGKAGHFRRLGLLSNAPEKSVQPNCKGIWDDVAEQELTVI